ncbi:MAG TPA: pyruvate synthase subunit beta [Candidatus Methanoperedenaceae archaeon]|nr:pyruvate synthase subunit beta [Candidatus Methanoperedenaceae archaeon]
MRDLPDENLFVMGHTACPGCGVAISIRNALRILGKNTVVYVPASCGVVFSATYPHAAMKVPFLHTAFENTGACISGLKAAYEKKGKNVNVVGFAGDGGTYDIGLQSVSGAAERNEDVIYICLDNEAYMNTGIQRSGSTPFGAWTTTTPVGKLTRGKREFKKDLPEIMAAHDIPYLATLSVAHPADFIRKVEKAKTISGFRFLHMLTPCVPGWKIDQAKSIEILKLAVDTGMWTLYEFEYGERKVTYRPGKMRFVKDYLMMQGRFRHMSDEDIKRMQGWVCRKWGQHYGEKGSPEVCPVELPAEHHAITEDHRGMHGP